MRIDNLLLNLNEKSWINALLHLNFDEEDKLINQINKAKIERQFSNLCLSIKFHVNKLIEPVKIGIRVPIEMRVYRTDNPPVQFLLHILNGYISEIEIFSADSTKIYDDIKLEKIEVILADELKNVSKEGF